MTALEFYEIVRKIYPNYQDLQVADFVNPMKNHCDEFQSIQFVKPKGEILGKWWNLPKRRNVVAEPLAGPFYQLEVESWWYSKCETPISGKNYYVFGVWVSLDGEKKQSDGFSIETEGDLEELKEALGDLPYVDESDLYQKADFGNIDYYSLP